MGAIEQFASALSVSIEAFAKLEGLLLSELAALQTKDMDQLAGVITSKLEVVAAIESETERQRRSVEAAGFPFSPDGIAQLFAAHDADGELARRWNQLYDAVKRANRLNLDNARVIERDRRRTATALKALSGDDGITTTYDPFGRTQAGATKSRTLSQA